MTDQRLTLTDSQLYEFQMECLKVCMKLQLTEGFLTLQSLVALAASGLPIELQQTDPSKLVMRRTAAYAARDAGCHVSDRLKLNRLMIRTVWPSLESYRLFRARHKRLVGYGFKSAALRDLQQRTINELKS